MMRARWLATALCLLACSGEDHPAASSNPRVVATSNDPGAPSDGGHPDASTNDGGAPDASACVVTATATDGVPITVKTGETRPDATGGTIGLGTFKLTERDFYPDATEPDAGAGEPDGLVLARTIVFAASDAYSVAEVATVPGDPPTTTLSNGTYTAIDRVVSITQTCPDTALSNARFTIVGGQSAGQQLWLFPREKYREIYTRTE